MKQSFRGEIFAGITTALSACYIVMANPAVLVGPGRYFQGVMTATVLVCIIMSFFIGIYVKKPYLIAPGMGINAMVASIMLKHHVELPVALGIVFWSGVLFLVVVLTPLRRFISRVMPKGLRTGLTVALGGVLCITALKQIGLLRGSSLVAFGRPTFEWLLCFIGLGVIWFLARFKKAYAVIVGVILVSLVYWGIHGENFPKSFLSSPDFSTFLVIDFKNSLRWVFIPIIMALFFTDFFDAVGTLIALSEQLEQESKDFEKGLLVSALATIVPPFLGSSSGTIYLESSTGIQSGGKSGWTAGVAAMCFIPLLFLGPVVQAIPDCAIGAVLLFVGVDLIRNIKTLAFNKTNMEEWIAACVLILFVLLKTLALGIFTGLMSYIGICLFCRKYQKISVAMIFFCIVGFLMACFI